MVCLDVLLHIYIPWFVVWIIFFSKFLSNNFAVAKGNPNILIIMFGNMERRDGRKRKGNLLLLLLL